MPTGGQQPAQTPQPNQQVLKQTVDQMIAAFNEFHTNLSVLKKQQQDIARHIRGRVDQEKIDQLKQMLNQV
ncbi:MAG: hypothetical protein HYV32_04480 [Candidatus Kerfeldbacteria bacterium]|nr:hypothetical protein [Candidatus Kerfeldbacteria bacterium]